MSTFVCIASGPSLSQDQIDLVWKYKKQKALTVIGVNDNWQWKSSCGHYVCDHIYAADDSWWSKYIKKINQSDFSGMKWIPIKKDFAKKNGLTMIPCKYQNGLGKNGTIHCGHNSGFQSINLAYHLGADKIILIGYDMKVNGKKVHWFGDHPQGLRNTPGKYQNWIKHHEQLNKDLLSENIEVVNCSKDTAIPYYRKSTLQKELEVHSNSRSSSLE